MGYYPGNDVDLGTIVGSDQPLILTRQDRARHTYMVGSSRTGKTKLMEGIGRQDILKSSNDNCPVVVIDPHDTLYDGLMAYAAAEGLNDWPIIPFDLRRNDLIVSYDLLRKRKGVNLAVICRALVEAIIHAWGQTNTQETPRLASTLESVIMVAVEKECSISESLQLISDPSMRQALLADVKHMVARTTLQSAQSLGERGFLERTESTMYRLNAFLTNIVVEATFCARTGESLDLSEVLEKGKILLVCLSTAGANISAADAAAVGSVLLTDLWTAAKRRGKAEEGERVPCYVHIDEFQNYLTPDIAIGLSEASGFGLHLTLAHQYPSQLPDRGGQLGEMILNAVLATAKNKFVFQLEHPEDLDRLALVLGRQMVNVDKIRREIHQTKVMGYKLAYLPSYNESDTEGITEGEKWGKSHQLMHSATANWADNVNDATVVTGTVSKTAVDGTTTGTNASVTEGEGDAVGEVAQHSRTQVDTTNELEGKNWTDAKSASRGGSAADAKNNSLSLRYGSPSADIQGALTTSATAQYNKEAANTLISKDVADITLNQGQTATGTATWQEQDGKTAGGTSARGKSHADGSGESDAKSRTHNKHRDQTRGSSLIANHQDSLGSSLSVANQAGNGHMEGGSETDAEGFGTSHELSLAKNASHTKGRALNPILLPIMGKELSSVENEPIADQLFRIAQFLDGQPDRHCMVRLASHRYTRPLYTATVLPPLTTPEFRDEWATRCLLKHPFAITCEAASRRISERKARLRGRTSFIRPGDEAVERRRRISPVGAAT